MPNNLTRMPTCLTLCLTSGIDLDFTYRIYSRISREILDILDDNFFQFDLYAGHKK